MAVKQLSPEEKELVHEVFARGPTVLIELGYSPAQVREFMHRSEVDEEIKLLEIEMENLDSLMARTKFATYRQLMALRPRAVEILAQSLDGPVYQRDSETGAILYNEKNQPLVEDLPPTASQTTSAESVLDRVGVHRLQKHEPLPPSVNLNVLFGVEVKKELELDPELQTEEQRALARERIRNVISILRDEVPEARKHLLEYASATAKNKQGPRKKTTRKKTNAKDEKARSSKKARRKTRS
jgi:hypothetical protein